MASSTATTRSSSWRYYFFGAPVFTRALLLTAVVSIVCLIVSAPLDWFRNLDTGNCMTMWGYKLNCNAARAELTISEMPFCYALRNRITAAAAINLFSIFLNFAWIVVLVVAIAHRRPRMAQLATSVMGLIVGGFAGAGWACMFDIYVENICDNLSLVNAGWETTGGFAITIFAFATDIAMSILNIVFTNGEEMPPDEYADGEEEGEKAEDS